MSESKRDLLDMAADLVAAYVSANSIAPGELPQLIRNVHAALEGLAADKPKAGAAQAEPAVPIKRSITPDHLICLEDGKKFKSLKRHLRTRYGLTPDAYRAKWGLPADYPMVAPNYAKERSSLAKRMGLGQSKRTDDH